jgi:hypothetical protein
MSYTCELCDFTTNIKTHYLRHCNTEKHKLKTVPELAKQLANIKIEEIELKTQIKLKENKDKQEAKQIELELKEELKRLELEKKQELKQKEIELKQQIKEELGKSQEKVVLYTKIERSIPLVALMEQVIDRPTIEDYNNIYNGVITFEEIFIRDFLAEYKLNKSFVIEKGGKVGYYINNAPCLWFLQFNDIKTENLYIYKLIPLYHQYLKDWAKENGCNVQNFHLTEAETQRLKEWMVQETTYSVSLPKE